ncbi:MAG: hypothetical protein HYZ26_11615 [Chloroflexi bacterium]|nr:hypothetical protein [Chloroflexota bacterium]
MQGFPGVLDLIPQVLLIVVHSGLLSLAALISQSRLPVPKRLIAPLLLFIWLAPILLPLPVRWLLWGLIAAGYLHMRFGGFPGVLSWLTPRLTLHYLSASMALMGLWYLFQPAQAGTAALGAVALASSLLLLNKSGSSAMRSNSL